MHPYDRLVAFVNDNLDHFTIKLEAGPQAWSIEEWTDAIRSCYYIMENVAMYDELDDNQKMTYDDLLAAFVWALENYRIEDDCYYILERNEGVMTLLARAIKDEILYKE